MANKTPLDDFILARKRQDKIITSTLEQVQADVEAKRIANWENSSTQKIQERISRDNRKRLEDEYQAELLEKKTRFAINVNSL